MKNARLIVTFFCFLCSCSGGSDELIEASGTIEGTDVRVSSEVGGRITGIRVDEGSAVSAGDTLVIIDETELRLQLREAVSSQEAAEAQFQLAVEGPRKEDILQSETVYRTAERDYLRLKDLLASRTVTQRQYDDAYARYVSAQQTYEKLIAGSRETEITAARARRDQAEARSDQLRKRINDCTIVAPMDGVITLRAAEPGELAVPGGGLLRITKLDPVELTIYVNQVDLASVNLGAEADVTIDGDEGRIFPGEVIYISDVAEFTPKNVQTKEERTKLVYAVKIRLPNTDSTLKPGMPADAVIHSSGSASE